MSTDSTLLADRIAAAIRVVPDFPSPGIMFQDVTPVLADAELFRASISALSEPWRGAGITHVAGIESRGFIFGAPIAYSLGLPFVVARKLGKLRADHEITRIRQEDRKTTNLLQPASQLFDEIVRK